MAGQLHISSLGEATSSTRPCGKVERPRWNGLTGRRDLTGLNAVLRLDVQSSTSGDDGGLDVRRPGAGRRCGRAALAAVPAARRRRCDGQGAGDGRRPACPGGLWDPIPVWGRSFFVSLSPGNLRMRFCGARWETMSADSSLRSAKRRRAADGRCMNGRKRSTAAPVLNATTKVVLHASYRGGRTAQVTLLERLAILREAGHTLWEGMGTPGPEPGM